MKKTILTILATMFLLSGCGGDITRPTPFNETYFFNEQNGHYYQLKFKSLDDHTFEMIDWETANHEASRRSYKGHTGRLAVIDDKLEMLFIDQTFTDAIAPTPTSNRFNCWIGLRERALGEWRWIDDNDHDVEFDNWLEHPDIQEQPVDGAKYGRLRKDIRSREERQSMFQLYFYTSTIDHGLASYYLIEFGD